MGIGLAVLSPFVLAFEILYLLFHYSQSFRASPLSVSLRRWTPHAQWLFREYNELPHLFQARIARSYDCANAYIGMFPQPVLQRFLRAIAFLSGGLITLLFVGGLITDSGYLLTLEIVKGKSIAWLLSVLASIYGICKISAVGAFEPREAEERMEQLEQVLHYDFRDARNSAHTWEAYGNVSRCFRPIIYELIMELFSAVLNPFLFIVVIPVRAPSIVDFVGENSTQVPGQSWICSFSVFSCRQLHHSRSVEQKNKYERSLANFNREYMGDDSLISFGSGVVHAEELPLCEIGDTDGCADILGNDGGPFFV
jgi:autophagy-related protein 9